MKFFGKVDWGRIEDVAAYTLMITPLAAVIGISVYSTFCCYQNSRELRKLLAGYEEVRQECPAKNPPAPENNASKKEPDDSLEKIVEAQESREDYLAKKVGFRFDVDNCESRKRFECLDTPPIRIFNNYWGKLYHFEINKFVGVYESLTIWIYNGENLGSNDSVNNVLINDVYHDGWPSEITIWDNVNNTQVTIKRSKDGALSYNSPLLNDASAKELFGRFSADYAWFKKSNNIEAKIAEYTPKFVISECDSSPPRVIPPPRMPEIKSIAPPAN